MASKLTDYPPYLQPLADLVEQLGHKLALLGERQEETNKQIKQLAEQIGATDRRFGSLAEAMTLGDAMELLNSHPQLNVHSVRHNDEGRHEGRQYEIDAFAFGDDCVIVMEDKATLKSGHVSDFVNKSVNLRKFFDLYPHHQGKKLYGAVAYLKMTSKAKELADKKGLLIIRSTHANKAIANPEVKLRDYTPKARTRRP